MDLERKLDPFLQRLGECVINYQPKFFEKTVERRIWWINTTFDLRFAFCYSFIAGVKSLLARLKGRFKVRTMPSIPAGKDPFQHDIYQMGTYIDSRHEVLVMYPNFTPCTLDIIHVPTGGRIRVELPVTPVAVPAANNSTLNDLRGD